MQTPEISVIVPAFRPKDFTDLRFSMTSNAGTAAEWIVVDDGSGSGFDLHFAALEAEGVRLVRLDSNRRQAAARNAGLAAARGKWVKFLDADDRLESGHLSALLDAAQKLEASGARDTIPFASTRHVYPSGKWVENLSWQGLEDNAETQLERMIHAPFLHHCGPIYPRALLERIGGYDETLVTDEDGDLLLRLLQTGVRFRPVPGVSYVYQHHDAEGRVSRDDVPEKIAARLRVCDKLQAAVKASAGGVNPALAQALAIRLDRIALSAYPLDKGLSRQIIERAEVLAPGHRYGGSWPVRLAWKWGGPGSAIAVQRALQWLRRIRY